MESSATGAGVSDMEVDEAPASQSAAEPAGASDAFQPTRKARKMTEAEEAQSAAAGYDQFKAASGTSSAASVVPGRSSRHNALQPPEADAEGAEVAVGGGSRSGAALADISDLAALRYGFVTGAGKQAAGIAHDVPLKTMVLLQRILQVYGCMGFLDDGLCQQLPGHNVCSCVGPVGWHQPPRQAASTDGVCNVSLSVVYIGSASACTCNRQYC